ncbi:hypothetical protein Tco_0302871 [Tanacetum coccineum]
MSAYSLTMHHLASCLPSILHASCMVSYKENDFIENSCLWTTEAIEKITRNRERHARIKIKQQLAAVQESYRQDREDFRKLKELVTSQFGQHS